MPHDRAEQEQKVRDEYEFVVFDGEYGYHHLALAVVDLFVSGGTYTLEYIKQNLKQFGLEVAQSMINDGVDPTKETIYGNAMVFRNWESPLKRKEEHASPSRRVYLPNKHVPYIAARRKTQPSPPQEDGYLVGDWDGTGTSKISVRRGDFLLCQGFLTDTLTRLRTAYGDGNEENQYLVGDWTGDRKDKFAVRREDRIIFQHDIHDVRGSEIAYGNGNREDQYLVGDWTGDGRDKIAVRRGAQVIYQTDISSTTGILVSFGNGNSEDQYLVGDWTGDGKDKLAVRRGGQIYYQRYISDHEGVAANFGNGNSENQYLVGDWTGDGKDKLAVRRGGQITYQSHISDQTGTTIGFGNG